MTEEGMPKNYRLLKGIVIILGILIVVMVVVLIVASIMKYNDQKSAESALVDKYRSTAPSVQRESTPFDIDLTLESGQEILSVENSDSGILVRIGQNGTTRKILLIDYSGEIIGTINIK